MVILHVTKILGKHIFYFSQYTINALFLQWIAYGRRTECGKSVPNHVVGEAEHQKERYNSQLFTREGIALEKTQELKRAT